MPITPLYAGLEGDPLNSTGEQIASTVNSLISITEGVPESLFFDKATLDLNFATNRHNVYGAFGLQSTALTTAITTTRNSTATYQSPTAITTAATNVPRITYDAATGNPLGLLSEEQRTNLLLRSQEFDNAVWSKTSATVTANATSSPGGLSALDADKVIAEAANSTHWVRQVVGAIGSTMYTLSIYVKAAGYSKGRLRFGTNIGFVSDVVFDLSAGTATGAGASIQSVGNDFFRVSLTASTQAAATQIQFDVYIRDSSGNETFAGDGASGLFLWGAQVEAGSFPTSYIPTTAAQVSRVADQLNATLPATTEGTIFCVCRGVVGVVGVNQSAFTLTDGTPNNRVVLRRNNSATGGTQYLVISSGTNVAQVNTTQKEAGQRNKFAISWKANQFLGAEDGSIVLNDTSGNTPVGMTQLGIGSAGSAFSGSESLNGTVERIVFIPRALTAAELQVITS